MEENSYDLSSWKDNDYEYRNNSWLDKLLGENGGAVEVEVYFSDEAYKTFFEVGLDEI